MFPSVPGMDEVFGNIRQRGDRMKRAESRKCGCQKHSVLLEKLPGNGGGLHCSRRHGTKGSARRETGGINMENPHYMCVASSLCEWVLSC